MSMDLGSKRGRLALLAVTIASVAALVALPATAFAAKGATGAARLAAVTKSIAPAGVSASVTPGKLIAASFAELDLTGRTTTRTGPIGLAEDDQDAISVVLLFAGETVDLSMSGPDATDFDLAVFEDGETELAVVGGDEGSSYPARVSFMASHTGYYYVDVYTWVNGAENGGQGDYSLDVTVSRAVSQTTITRTANIAYGATTHIAGTVDGRFAGELPAGNVLLMFSTDGGRLYWPLLTQALSGAGTFDFTGLTPTTRVDYIVQYEGAPGFSPSASHAVIGTTAKLSTVSAKRYGTRSYTLSGTLRSQHTSGSSPVRIYLWRYVSGKYRSAGYRTAKASNTSDYSTIKTNYRFPYSGKWRMQAYHSDTGHLTTRSSYSYVTVR